MRLRDPFHSHAAYGLAAWLSAGLMAMQLIIPAFAQEEVAPAPVAGPGAPKLDQDVPPAPQLEAVPAPSEELAPSLPASAPLPVAPVATAPAIPALPSPDVMPAIPDNQPIPFPPLPPSKACRANDVLGSWRLVNVYEKPAGYEQSAFARTRFQYLNFSADSLLGAYSSVNNDLTLDQILAKLTAPDAQTLQQYVFKSGFLYFYKNGKAINDMACFIVANAKPPFAAGQMLMMPPKEQAAGKRLVKVYERLRAPEAVAPAAPNPAPPAPRRNRNRVVPPPAAITQ